MGYIKVGIEDLKINIYVYVGYIYMYVWVFPVIEIVLSNTYINFDAELIEATPNLLSYVYIGCI